MPHLPLETKKSSSVGWFFMRLVTVERININSPHPQPPWKSGVAGKLPCFKAFVGWELLFWWWRSFYIILYGKVPFCPLSLFKGFKIHQISFFCCLFDIRYAHWSLTTPDLYCISSIWGKHFLSKNFVFLRLKFKIFN